MPRKLIKNVSFRDNDHELKLMEHASGKRNFSEWVKQKLEDDMRGVGVKVSTEKTVGDPVEVDDNLF